MKRLTIFSVLLLTCVIGTPAAPGQKGCEFNIVGTWRVEGADQTNPILYRFTPDTRVAVLSKSAQSAEVRELAGAVYALDNPNAPKVIIVKADREVGGFAQGMTSMDIVAYDDTSLTVSRIGNPPTRWFRVDPYRYFIVLAGRIGTFYDGSGPTFPMLIKTDGQRNQIDAVGTYDVRGYWAFGPIPPETYVEFMKDPRKDTDVMLRLEITAAQYERGLKVVKTWERRARNNELLYPDLTMDNILLAKQVTESLNQCGEKFKLYKLDWSMEDRISTSSPRDDNPISRIPFLYFKELKRLNQSLHVPDDAFYRQGHPMQKQAGR